MFITFERRKQDILTKSDKSNIGSWDEPILKLCNVINECRNMYTTSSCSGRIVLLKDEKKGKGLFLFRSHQKVSFNELKEALDSVEYGGTVMFKQEPGILHVACQDLEVAIKLLSLARDSGWKHSGIIGIKGRVMVELIGTEHLDFPIMINKEILVSDDYIKLIIKDANSKLGRTWDKIKSLEKSI